MVFSSSDVQSYIDSYKVRVRQPVVNSALFVVNFCRGADCARERERERGMEMIQMGGGYVFRYIIERRRYSLRAG